MTTLLTFFLVDDSGATAIDYALIAFLISLAGLLELQALSGSLSQAFADLSNDLLALTRD